MKPRLKPSHWFSVAGVGVLVASITFSAATPVPAAEPNVLRLAVGPFFAPSGNVALIDAAAQLPDLLTVELSKQSRFQLAEREQVRAATKELNLGASGLTASDTVLKLGKLLSADWLVSGSLISTGTRTQIWTKVIDMHTGIVLDFSAVPYAFTNLTATLSGVAEFVGRAGLRPVKQQFVGLGRFQDFTTGSGKQDWSRRLQALVEEDFHRQGFGVVEREAVSPLLQEWQLDEAGLTVRSNNPGQVQTAFWLVDGGCHWEGETQDRLAVVLRVQKVGYKEEIVRFSAAPGPDVESTVLRIIRQSMSATNLIALEKGRSQEADIHVSRGNQLAERREILAPAQHFADGSATEQYRKREENRQNLIHNYEAALLLNPSDLDSKYRLGLALYAGPEAGKARGLDILKEILASTRTDLAEQCRARIAFMETAERQGRVSHGPSAAELASSPEDMKRLEQAAQDNPSDLTAKYNLGAALNHARLGADRARGWKLLAEVAAGDQKELADRARKLIPPAAASPSVSVFSKYPTPIVLGQFPTMTAVMSTRDRVLIASGTSLYRCTNGSQTLERIDLPAIPHHPITALRYGEGEALWLGTDGGGLLKVSASGQLLRTFGPADGLLSQSIKALALLDDGRLWIGFGSGNHGGFGYLEVTTEKFVPLTLDGAERPDGPPAGAVTEIKTVNATTLWLATSSSLKRFESDSGKWTTPLACAPRGLAVAPSFIAVGSPTGGVLVCSPKGEQWRSLRISSIPAENLIPSLRAEQDQIWVGGEGKLWAMTMPNGRIYGDCTFEGGLVRWINPAHGVIWFVADGPGTGNSTLYRFDRHPKNVAQAQASAR